MLRDGPQPVVGEAQVDAVHLQQRLILAHHRVGRAGHDQVEIVLGQRFELDADGQPPQELGEEAVVEQLLLGDAPGGRGAALEIGAETDRLGRIGEVHVGERPRGDEQDVLRVDDDEVVFVPVLRDVEGREDLASFEQLEQTLLNALAADVAGPGAGAGAVAAPRDLVDLVDEHDSALRELDVLIGVLQELADHDLDVLAVVAGFRVFGRVGDRERHIEAAGERARDVRLARTGGTEQQHVGLLDQPLARGGRLGAALEVVVRGDGDRALGALLADDVAIEVVEDLTRRQRLFPLGDAGIGLHAAASIPPHL